LLEYDDVMNKQREAVYGLRRRLLEGTDQKDLILEDYVSAILGELLEQHCSAKAHAAALAADLKITPSNGSRGVDPAAGIITTVAGTGARGYGGDGGPDDDRTQRGACRLRRGGRVPGLPGQ